MDYWKILTKIHTSYQEFSNRASDWLVVPAQLQDMNLYKHIRDVKSPEILADFHQGKYQYSV